jgi:putative membrane protein
MDTLAHLAYDGGGPGPWILFFPLLWATAVAGVILVLRRTVWRGRGRGPWQPRAGHEENSPLHLLGRRFAAGEIDEDEYWRRLSVLDEQFGRSKGGAA